MKQIITIAMALLATMGAEAKVTLPQLFQPGMVLQRNQPIPVWGWADKGESVAVTFRKKTYTATADDQGCWRVELPKQKAGGPYTLDINGERLDSVLIGDVWLCSGQSNIDVTIERVYPQYGSVIDEYSNPLVRMFRVQTDTDTHGPKRDIRPTHINWKPVTKQNAWLFSAVGYFLGREMFDRTGVPQGIIVNSLGGTPIQAWLPADTLRRHFPEELQRTLFYQDDEMVRTMQRANQMATRQWDRLMNEADQPGEDGWQTKNQYDNLTGQHQYRGSFWARQTIKIDAAHAGQPARLLVGTLFDADFTYVNGRQVGNTGYQYPPRRYNVPEGLLKQGDNTLSIRFITKGGNPHFIKDKPYKLIFNDGSEIALSETWQVHKGVEMPACPQIDCGIQNLPTVLYNAMLAPLAPYALSGVVWYQGESNSGADARNYEKWLTELVAGWRQVFTQPSLPFVVVQLANYMDPSDKPQDTGWCQVREAQRLVSEKVPSVGLATAIDLGETVDIHPLRKREVAQRVANAFDRLVFNGKSPVSPRVISATIKDNTVVLTTDQPMKDEAALKYFEIAAQGGRFQNVEASVKGNAITIALPNAGTAALKVRYAWRNNPLGVNAYSTAGLPLPPFEMDVQQ